MEKCKNPRRTYWQAWLMVGCLVLGLCVPAPVQAQSPSTEEKGAPKQAAILLKAAKAKYARYTHGKLNVKYHFKGVYSGDTTTYDYVVYYRRMGKGKKHVEVHELFDVFGYARIYNADELVRYEEARATFSVFPADAHIGKLNEYGLFLPAFYPQSFFRIAKATRFQSLVETDDGWVLEKGSSRLKMRYLIGKADTLLKQVEQMIHTKEGWQYKSYRIEGQAYLNDVNVPDNWYSRAYLPTTYTEKDPYERKYAEVEAGSEAFTWVLPALDRDSLRLNQMRDTVLLLDFWYQGCAPCVKALPSMQALQDHFADRAFRVVGINTYDQNQAFMRTFLQARGVKYPIALAHGRTDLIEAYRVHAYPTLVVLDRTHRVAYTQSGFGPGHAEALKKVIEELLP